MNNRKVLVLLLLVLAALAVYFIYFREDSAAVREDLRDFAVEDTASIGKITIRDKRPMVASLERTEKGWTVNGKFPARQDAIQVLLTTLHDMTVKNPVGKAMEENVLNNMATYGQTVQLYDLDGNLIKTLYIGGPTHDHTGTFAMIKNAKSPYVIYIPGFEGYLSTRFFADENPWRDRIVMDLENNEISKVSLNFPTDPDKGFILSSDNFESFDLKTPTGEVVAVDTLAAKQYLSGFRKLNFEGVVAQGDKVNQDSILVSQPFAVLEVLDNSGNRVTVKAYRKPNTKFHTLADGSVADFDVNRFYGSVDGKTLMTMQYLLFDRVLVTRERLEAKISG